MKILCVEPGPTHSTYDVYQGLAKGLRACGHTVGAFALHNRIEHADRCLQLRWEAAGSLPEQKPRPSDVLFHASSEVLQYALLHQVDLVLFISCGLVHPAVYTMLRRAGVPTGMVLTESPYEDERQAEMIGEIDLIWTNERTSVELLRPVNPNVSYLRHAYDPQRHRPSDSADESVPRHDVVFVGTLWQERIDLLASVDWTGIDLGIYGSADLFDFERYPSADNERKAAELAPYLHVGFVTNERTTALYRAAKIGLNFHRTSMGLTGDLHVVDAESMNPRCYEQAATGGALLLSDSRQELLETFGEATPTFVSADDLEHQVRHFISHDAEREQRVRALQAAVAPHTFEARAAQIVAECEAYLSARPAKGA